MFEKYARAIDNARERRELHKRYLTRNILFTLTLVLLIVSVILMSFLPDPETAAEIPPIFYAILGLLVAAIASGIASLVSHIRFRQAFREILARPPMGDTPTEAYRAAMQKEESPQRKWPVFVLIAACLVGGVMIGIDAAREQEEVFTPMTIAAGCIILAGILFYFVISVLRAQKQQNFEQNVGDVVADIDAGQGRKTKYNPAYDRNAQTLRYLYPTETLRVVAEQQKMLYAKRLSIGLVVGLVIGAVVGVIACTSLLFSQQQYIGYLFPLVVSVMTVAIIISIWSPARKLSRLDKQQYELLDEQYADNRRIFDMYRRFSATWGRFLYGALIACLLAAFVIAIFLPKQSWSVLTVVPMLGAVFLYNRAFAGLRQSVRPIEDAIDRKAVEAAAEADGAPTVAEPAESIADGEAADTTQENLQ